MIMNNKLLQLYRVIEYKTRTGEISPPIRVRGYKLEDRNEFENSIIKIPSLRRAFWDENHVKFKNLGIDIKSTYQDFESYYEIDESSDLSAIEIAEIKALKASGVWVEVGTVGGNCPTTAGYMYKKFPKDAADGGTRVCLQKKKSEENFPLNSTADDPLYCIKNQKYYSMRRKLLASFNKDRQCHKISADGVSYWICYFFNGDAQLIDKDDKVVLEGGWECDGLYAYVVVFKADPKHKIPSQSLYFTVSTKDDPIVTEKL